jgi:hypothetical protein
MASPFQQQVRQRKLLYIGLILVLFTVSLLWRKTAIAGLAQRLAIRESDRGEVELTGAVVRLGLTGSRGLATCILWNNAIEKQKKNQWNELEVLVRSLTKLQPHFITPWLFQSWNLAYNVSVESDRVRDKYFYVSRGVELLAEGERQNRDHPDLRWSIGFYVQHKICQSDETNYQRSLLQLSLIPPNERDPARFWKQGPDGGAEFNWAEFDAFCRQHPQLARRLKEGMHRETVREKRKQFTCEKPEQVVQFLEENFNIPSIYQSEPLPAGVPASARLWDPRKQDKLIENPGARFPILPPPHERPFDPDALNTDSTMRDDTDGFTVAHAWFCYAQEPLPDPSKTLPGNSEEITDRAHKRRPRNMTTLIFRNYPAQACRYMGERLQQEGWYDDEPWDASEWFSEERGGGAAAEGPGTEHRYGGGKKWSLEAWRRSFRAWQSHGEENLLLFPTAADEQNMRDKAERFAKKRNLPPGGSPPPFREEDMNREEREEFLAAKFMFEYDFYRRVSNFPHHYNRSMMEQREETVACRKLFYQAEQLDLAGSPQPALDLYRTPIEVPSVEGWRGRKLSPLDAWRELVLMKNKEFRRDSFAQEQSAEYELRYLRLHNRFDGRKLKEEVAKAAAVLPLVPKMTPDDFRAPVLPGPFDVNDDEGQPLVDESSRDTVLERVGLGRRRQMSQPPPGVTGPEAGALKPVPVPVKP